MIWIGRVLEILQVAGHARGARKVVVIINVAVGTLPRRHRVQAGEWKTRGVVIKRCIQP